jgi:hypothetical protein
MSNFTKISKNRQNNLKSKSNLYNDDLVKTITDDIKDVHQEVKIDTYKNTNSYNFKKKDFVQTVFNKKDINLNTMEGKLLLAAITKIMIEYQPEDTSNKILKQLYCIAKYVNKVK